MSLITKSPPVGRLKKLELDGSASYLLAGGLGGLGRAVSRYLTWWSTALGAWSTYPAAAAEDQTLVRELQSMGCEVLIVKGSVSDEDDVNRALQQAPSLKGIVNFSMALYNQAFTRMTLDEWEGAVSPKVKGTWNLHNASIAAGAVLEFFVLFSSLSGIIGQTGQANYAGANTFLNSFVQYRNQLGLAASAIDIGGVEDIGFISKNDELLRKIKMTSSHSIREVELLEAVGAAMMLLPASTATSSELGGGFVSRNTFVLGLGTHMPPTHPETRAIWCADRHMAVYHNRAAKGPGSRACSSEGLKVFLAGVRADTRERRRGAHADARNWKARIRLPAAVGERPGNVNSGTSGPSWHGLTRDHRDAHLVAPSAGLPHTVVEMLELGSLDALGKHAVEGFLRATEENRVIGSARFETAVSSVVALGRDVCFEDSRPCFPPGRAAARFGSRGKG